MTGKVYFVSAPGRIKIGYTRNPERRLASLQAVDMERLSVIAVIDGTRNTEQRLHKELHAYWVRGEWFRDCEEVRAVIDGAALIPADVKSVPVAAPVTVSGANVFFDRRALPVCQQRADQLLAALVGGTDKYEIQRMARELIASTEVLLGRSIP